MLSPFSNIIVIMDRFLVFYNILMYAIIDLLLFKRTSHPHMLSLSYMKENFCSSEFILCC